MFDQKANIYREVERLNTEDIPAKHPSSLFHDYWSKIKADKLLPFRKDFSPMDIPSLLPYLVLVEPEMKGGELDFYIRLEGEYVANLSGNQAGGKYFSDIMGRKAFEEHKKEFFSMQKNLTSEFCMGHLSFFKKDYVEIIKSVHPFTLTGNDVELFVIIVAAKNEGK